MILNFKKEINDESADLLIDFINSTEGIKKKIYLSSDGGFIYVAELIIDLINNNKQDIELIAYNYIGSSAFELFFKSKCKKRILEGTRGMLHFAKMELTVNQKGKPVNKTAINFLKEEVSKRNDNLIKKLKLSSKELNKYNKGEDVEFSYNRMLEFLKNDSV